MRILITGSEGVLGSVLKQELRRQGHIVWGCDLGHSADPQVMRADISESRQVRRAFRKSLPDLVYHFAAEFGRKNGQDFYEQLWKTNCIGTHNVIEETLARKATLIFASSSEAYGMSEEYNGKHPLTESLLERYVPRFHNEYALSKYTNEKQIQTAVKNDGLKAIVLRFFNVYGPPERFSPYRSVVCQFIYKMLTDQPVTVNRGGYRSHLWIGDWCDTVAGIVKRLPLLSTANLAPVPTFNIGSDDYESIEELFNQIADLTSYDRSKAKFIETEENNTAFKRVDTTRSRLFLGHNPATSLREGLFHTIDWMRATYQEAV